MAGDDLYDKRRGQRMLLTKWVKVYNSTDDEAERERAAHKVADVLAWARSIGMSPSEIAEKRDLPHRALELLETGGGSASPADDAEVREAAREVESDRGALEGGGREWYRTTVAEIVTIYHSLLGCADGREPHAP